MSRSNRFFTILLILPVVIHAFFMVAQEVKTLEAGVVKITAQVGAIRKVGTGFIIQVSPDAAYIVTASHVVEGDRNPKVEFFTRRGVPVSANVVGLEGRNPTGLGLLLVKGKENLPSGLSALPFAPSIQLKGGDDVIVIGFPRKAGDWSAIIKGNIVSRQGREIMFSGAIDEGCSGGPLIRGSQVVGLVTELTEPYGRAALATSVQEFVEGYGVKPPSKPAAKPVGLPVGNTKIAFVSIVRFPNGAIGDVIDVINADGTQARLTDPRYIRPESPCWSPDGTKIAFVSLFRDNREIYVMNADGTEPTRLTNTKDLGLRTDINSPSWSPDWAKVAFHSTRSQDAVSGRVNDNIYVMNADGTNLTLLTNHPGEDSAPSWSPEGKKIAFVSNRDGNLEIYVMNADGSNPTRLTHHPEGDYSPSWSPDGKKIAFVSTRDDNSEIYVMNADGTNPTRLTNHPALDRSPSWSPDGNKIAFVSDRDPREGIYLMNADGTNPTFLTVGDSPSWSRILK